MSPHVSQGDLRHAAVENAPGPQARVCFLALFSACAGQLGRFTTRQDGAPFPPLSRARSVVPDLSRQEEHATPLSREKRAWMKFARGPI